MAGTKETYEIELNPDQMAFIQRMQEQFEIASESKVLRVMVDYLIQNEEVHELIFSEMRCLRCG